MLHAFLLFVFLSFTCALISNLELQCINTKGAICPSCHLLFAFFSQVTNVFVCVWDKEAECEDGINNAILTAAARSNLIVQACLREPPTNSSVAVKVHCSQHHNVSVILDVWSYTICYCRVVLNIKKGLLFGSVATVPLQKTSFNQISQLSLRKRCISQSAALWPQIMSVFTLNSLCLHCLSEHKVIIVGLDNAGKTTILYQL